MLEEFTMISDDSEIGLCPNPKCRKPVPSDHEDPWCYECGERFPDDLVAKLPRIMMRRSAAMRAISDPAADQLPTATNPRAGAVMRRYRDAYRVSKLTIGAGSAIKGAGVGLAVFLALIDLAAEPQIGTLAFFAGLVMAAGVGLVGWLGGVLLGAHGQLLLATLDGVVGDSPFLTVDEKARAMVLP